MICQSLESGTGQWWISRRVPPGYVYQSPYLAAAAPGGLVPLPATQLTHAAAMAAASQFYEYQNVAAAAATYPGTSYNFAEAYPYTSAAAAANAAAASYVTPYTYATLPGAAAGLPAAAAAAATAAGAAFPGLPYQTTPQEARLQ
ncbi:RNA-binding protein 24-like isoform X2 [Apis florea]|uniref:RNA-binding protein 24-like isoform X2 n=1 Tax=Apis florea TaxID=7463 RepID=UPI0006292EC2|nr:RNA-binding protein 24-like isoform X2 [Apis florea]